MRFRLVSILLLCACLQALTQAQTDTTHLAPKDTIAKPKLYFKPIGELGLESGFKTVETKNPTLPEHLRKRRVFTWENSANLILEAGLGDRLKVRAGYSTNALPGQENRQINVHYQGLPNDILQSLDGGHFAFKSANPLIRPMDALFGIRTIWLWGPLEVETFASRQEGEAKRIAIDEGGAGSRPFEMKTSDYDANRHFFLDHYFRTHYNSALANLPIILSNVRVEEIEVWVTNRLATTDRVRDIIAVSTSETDQPGGGLQTTPWIGKSLEELEQSLPSTQMQQVEVIRNARQLSPEEYTINRELGYISLLSPLHPEDVLAVAYRVQYGGRSYTVGDLAVENRNPDTPLVMQLISGRQKTPATPTYPLMMKNVYRLGNSAGIDATDITVDLLYREPGGSILRSTLPGESTPLLHLLKWDVTKSNGADGRDGLFDAIEGVTINSQQGLLIFPLLEPFGRDLERLTQNGSQYSYKALYDSTLSVARSSAERDRFVIRGEYTPTGGAGEIKLDATHIPMGSVRVKAGGQLLREQEDYVVNYLTGTLRITNPLILQSNLPLEIELHDASEPIRKKRDLLGLEARLTPIQGLHLSTTLLKYSEESAINRTFLGQEDVSNRMIGASFRYDTRLNRLHYGIEKLTQRVHTTPTTLHLEGAFAQLTNQIKSVGDRRDEVIIDDFDSQAPFIDLSYPEAWFLGSNPTKTSTAHSAVEDGYGRALLAWYRIDPELQREQHSNPTTPSARAHYHYTRPISLHEIFPNKENRMGGVAAIPVLNLSFYPTQRGPYNLDAQNINSQGELTAPTDRWGAIVQPLPLPDFEENNIEYMEFWLMDPYLSEEKVSGNPKGMLTIDLGEISEDVLGDGAWFAENSLPNPSSPQMEVVPTVWGKAGKSRVNTQAFNFEDPASVKAQDVGLNGLSSEEEKQHPLYANYVSQVKQQLSPHLLPQLDQHPNSFLNDPAGDNYLSYRDPYWDAQPADLLTRYKYVNGLEGNSVEAWDSKGRSLAATLLPDSKDTNRDQALNSRESFFRYRIPLSKEGLQEGSPYIASSRKATVELPDGSQESVTWFKVRIPLKAYDQKTALAPDFRYLPYVRASLSGFEEEVHLRIVGWRLLQSDWRSTSISPDPETDISVGNSRVAVGSVGIEEDTSRTPISYVSPPHVSRELSDHSTIPLRIDEKSLSLQYSQIPAGGSMAVYKQLHLDLRDYRTMRLYTHAEALQGTFSYPMDGDLTLFLRLGSDLTDNYYEYELPLHITPPGEYSDLSPQDRATVWPEDNLLEIELDEWVRLKEERNQIGGQGRINPALRYGRELAHNPRHHITIKGHPSLGTITMAVIGIRNRSKQTQDAEIWVNHWHLTGGVKQKGIAAELKGDLTLGNIGTLSASGRVVTPGFGNIDASMPELSDIHLREWQMSSLVRLGELLPSKWRVNLPVYLYHSKRRETPDFDPLHTDVHLKTDLWGRTEKASSIEHTITQREISVVSIQDASIGIKSKKPMPYDPDNLRFSFSKRESTSTSPTSALDNTLHTQGSIEYRYTPPRYSWMPIPPKESSPAILAIQPWPTKIVYKSAMDRFYSEQQQRAHLTLSQNEALQGDAPPMILSHKWDWLHDMRLEWQVSPRLFVKVQNGHKALVREPYVRVNKRFDNNTYRIWRDSVVHEIKQWGEPTSHNTSTELTYTLPLELLKPLNNALGVVLRRYSLLHWQKGAQFQEKGFGNPLRGDVRFEMEADLNAERLYAQWFPHATGYKRNRHTPDGKISNGFETLLGQLPFALRSVHLYFQDYQATSSPHLDATVSGIMGGRLQQERVSTSLIPYMLGLKHNEAYLMWLYQEGWLLTQSYHSKPSTLNNRQEWTSEVRLQPTSRLRIELLWHQTNASTKDFYTNEEQVMARFSKSRGNSSSTIFKRHQTSSLLSFSFGRLSPSWDINYDIPIPSKWRKWLGSFSLKHSFRGLSSSSENNIKRYLPNEAAQHLIEDRKEMKNDFFPLIGAQVRLLQNASLRLQVNQSRALTLLPETGRMMEDERQEFTFSAGYTLPNRKWFPNLSAHPLWGGSQSLTFRLTLRNSLSQGWTHLISSTTPELLEAPIAVRGQKQSSLRATTEYNLGRRASFRLFYVKDATIPLVSSYTFPTVTTYIGLGVRLLMQ